MSNVLKRGGPSFYALALGAGLLVGPAFAQQSPGAQTGDDDEQTIVVTGSFIAGTPENAALPVDVITDDDLEKAGAPTTVEFIKLLNVSSGVQGDTNQFDARAQGNEGAGSVNLRGIGPERTLVLLNGRRMAYNPFGLVGTVVDTNLIPSAAIGRIEVLKDGAAATYGSDAIAGVVNFITKTNFEGVELGGDYKFIDGSDGNYTLSGNFGWANDTTRFLFSAGYQAKTELPITEREWSLAPFAINPNGGFSAAGNPGTYLPVSAAFAPLAGLTRDPGCTPLGGIANLSGTTPVCTWRFVPYDNIVEKENRYQIFTSLEVDLTPRQTLHIEALYANTDTPEWKTSPSYAFLQNPTGEAHVNPALAGRYFVPATNPGFIDMVAKNPTLFPAGTAGAFIFAYRPYGLGGNPAKNNERGASDGVRQFEAYRFSVGLKGEIGENSAYDIALTYMEDRGHRTGFDTLVNRFQLALRGLGGPNCNRALNTPGANGCLWFNPFSNAIQRNSITGETNPQFNPALAAQNLQVTDWFFQEVSTTQLSSALTFDAVFSGQMGLELPGGSIGWALGAQYRGTGFKSRFSQFSDLTQSPCLSSPDFNNNTCAAITGPTAFLSGSFPADISRDVSAAFTELDMPFTDNFGVQLAARYERYGGATGDTFNPKISARWQVFEPFAIRASAGSTFRAPSVSNIQAGSVTSLQSIAGVFRAVDIFGNPNLDPEKAQTYNVGFLFDAGNFTASVDYWRFDFDNPIVAEPIGGMVATMFSSTANCTNAAFAALLSRFTFNAGQTCLNGAAGISRVRTTVINGSAVKTDGVDVSAEYTFPDVFGGDLTLGGNATYTMKYEIDPVRVEGVQVAAGFDAVGKLNFQTTAYPLPQYKGTLFGLFERGGQSLRVAANFIDAYIDQRFITTPTAPGYEVDSWMSADITYRAELPSQIVLTAGVENVTNEDPPFARLDLSYDPFTHNPLGRTYKIGLKKTF